MQQKLWKVKAAGDGKEKLLPHAVTWYVLGPSVRAVCEIAGGALPDDWFITSAEFVADGVMGLPSTRFLALDNALVVEDEA